MSYRSPACRCLSSVMAAAVLPRLCLALDWWNLSSCGISKWNFKIYPGGRVAPNALRGAYRDHLFQGVLILSIKSARTRVAPSPTGHMHLATARVALYDYLLAKKTGTEAIEDFCKYSTIFIRNYPLYDNIFSDFWM